MFKKLGNKVKINLIIQALCLCVGTSTHVAWVVGHGFLFHDPRFSLYTQAFWDSLTFLDPLAAILLFASPKKGVILTTAIIVVDVVHNAFVGVAFAYATLPAWIVDNRFFILQLIFCVFVLASIRMNLKEIHKQKRPLATANIITL